MDIIDFHTVWTVIIFVGFFGIVFWAYSSRQKKRFDEAANLIFADEKKELQNEQEGHKS